MWAETSAPRREIELLLADAPQEAPQAARAATAQAIDDAEELVSGNSCEGNCLIMEITSRLSLLSECSMVFYDVVVGTADVHLAAGTHLQQTPRRQCSAASSRARMARTSNHDLNLRYMLTAAPPCPAAGVCAGGAGVPAGRVCGHAGPPRGAGPGGGGRAQRARHAARHPLHPGGRAPGTGPNLR